MYFWLHFNKHIDNRFFEANNGTGTGAGGAGNGDAGAGANGANGTGDGKSAEGDGKQKVTFTAEQQKAIDDIIAGRVAAIKSKAETDAAERIKKEQEKAELDKLQGDEKLKKERELFDKEKAEWAKSQRRLEADSLLQTAGLKIEGADEESTSTLLNFVTGNDLEGTKKNITSLQKIISSLVQKGVDGKLGASAGAFKGNPAGTKESDIEKDKLSDDEWFKRYNQKKTS